MRARSTSIAPCQEARGTMRGKSARTPSAPWSLVKSIRV